MRRAIFGLLLLVGCGGGGGGSEGDDKRGTGETSAKFAGTWIADFPFQDDPCGLTAGFAELGRGVLYLINQDGSNIAVENLTSHQTMSGGTTGGGDEFVATSAATFLDCGNGITGTTVGVLSFALQEDDTAGTQYEVTNTCDSRCNVTFTGRAVRQ